MDVSSPNCIILENVCQSFSVNNTRVRLFEGLNLSVTQGSSYAITGPSGTGKSSLLMLMAGMDTPESGKLCYLDNGKLQALSKAKQNIGFVFQQFHLLPELTALNNVALPLRLRGDKNAEEKARYWLHKVGMDHRLQHKPSQLSGGEQQRTAIARALVFEPKFIFADEPTGNLDSKSAVSIADLLFSCCEQHRAGLVVVTHSSKLAKRAQQIFVLNDGRCQPAVVSQPAPKLERVGGPC